MRPDLEDRQRLALSLTARLEDIATGRRNLVLQQKNLDKQEKAVQRESKSLHNMNAYISILPSEVLSMVFEAGALLDSSSRCHFGSLVSHVSRRWREIALETPRLWNKIKCIRTKVMGEVERTYSERERVAAFLSRSKSSPVAFHVQNFYDQDRDDIETRNFLAMLGDQVGRFYHLAITDGDEDGVFSALDYLSRKPASILRSILIKPKVYENPFELTKPLFPFGAPRLTIAQLDSIATSSLHFCISSFRHLQCLRLGGYGAEFDDHKFRDALMAFPVLNHLELMVDSLSPDATCFPVILPTLRFLQVATYNHGDLVFVIRTIHAASLTALSLPGWGREEPKLNLLPREEDSEPHFPALEHLILGNISKKAPDLVVVACMFPQIERLTCEMLSNETLFSGIDHILATIDTGSSSEGSRHWPKLHTIAVSGPGTPLDVACLHYKIYMMRDAGHPLRKLKLPKSLVAQASAKAVEYLQTIVDVEDFSLDWPTPFEGFT